LSVSTATTMTYAVHFIVVGVW